MTTSNGTFIFQIMEGDRRLRYEMKILAWVLVLVILITFEQFTMFPIGDNYTDLIDIAGFYADPMTLQTWKFLEHKKMRKNTQPKIFSRWLFVSITTIRRNISWELLHKFIHYRSLKLLTTTISSDICIKNRAPISERSWRFWFINGGERASFFFWEASHWPSKLWLRKQRMRHFRKGSLVDIWKKN